MCYDDFNVFLQVVRRFAENCFEDLFMQIFLEAKQRRVTSIISTLNEKKNIA